MQKAIKRLVDRIYPELNSKYHLPRFAEVVSVRETPADGSIADPFRPYYAVDVQVLDEYGAPDSSFPILYDVPLPCAGAGHEMGQFSFPDNGTRVEIAFAYGSADQPFIRTILPHNLSLPNIDRGEQRWQFGANSFTRVDGAGNWRTQTDGDISHDSLNRIMSALKNLETYTQSLRNVEADDTETVGGTKRIDALGALRLNSGGRFDFIALGELVATSGNAQILKSPKTWIGSSSVNVLGILSETLAQLVSLCGTLQTHTHSGVLAGLGTSGGPVQDTDIGNVGSSSADIKASLDSITE